MTAGPIVRPPDGSWLRPWPSVFEIAEALPLDRWALVGGLMVQAHALAAEVETTRVTVDVDAAVRVEAGAFSYAEAASALTTIGYVHDDSTSLAYRFTRGGDVIDLMVSDHERPVPRYGRRDVMQIEGGTQAMGRTHMMHFLRDSGDSNSVLVPTLKGALILKSAAHVADSRDRDRHLLDAVTLLACVGDIEPIISDLKGSDLKRLRHIIEALAQQPLIAAQAPEDTWLLAAQTVEELRTALAR